MRRIIFILIVVLVLLGIGYGIYRFFVASPGATTTPSPAPTPTTTVPPPTPQPTTAAGQLTQVTDEAIFDYWLNPGTKTIYYVGEDGKITRLSSGKKEVVGTQKIDLLSKLSASPDGAYALLSYGQSPETSFVLFNAGSSTLKALPQGVSAAAFSPDGGRIAFLEDKNGGVSLNILDLAHEQVQELTTIQEKDLSLVWVKNTTLLLKTQPSALADSSVWAIDLTKKTIGRLVGPDYGLIVQWSDDGTLGLKLSTPPRSEIKLQYVNDAGRVISTFPAPLTLPQKCLIEQSKIFCAVPAEIPATSLFPDDYFKKKFYTKDSFYVWREGATSTATSINPGVPVDARHLSINKNGDLLYFVNRYDRKLYSLNLKK